MVLGRALSDHMEERAVFEDDVFYTVLMDVDELPEGIEFDWPCKIKLFS